jgi:hypothetical protein
MLKWHVCWETALDLETVPMFSVGFTIFLGAAELAGALGLAFGVFTHWTAVGFIVVMMGAIYRKVVKWKTGFWGEKASGWHYDLIFVVMNLTILCTGGGRIALFPMPPNEIEVVDRNGQAGVSQDFRSNSGRFGVVEVFLQPTAIRTTRKLGR